jgi:hypothetical protein
MGVGDAEIDVIIRAVADHTPAYNIGLL